MWLLILFYKLHRYRIKHWFAKACDLSLRVMSGSVVIVNPWVSGSCALVESQYENSSFFIMAAVGATPV